MVLRALPLQTATEIELNPLQKIQVTLFDANHCPGAVSFLIQDQTSAIFYSGDLRAEPWWVNSLVQNASILPYSCGLKTLDCIYLDTTFASHKDVYRAFPSKAEGLKELLLKLAQYPPHTVFYLRAWTLGYEQVWIAMSSLLSSRVHVEEYQLRLFHAMTENSRDGYAMFEAPPLVGFTLGNQEHPGCLTLSSDTRIHSCEPGLKCHQQLSKADVVWVRPIISRLDDGTELLEAAVEDGMGDLLQTAELEIDDPAVMDQLYTLCTELRISEASFKRLQDAIATARASALPRLSLDRLGLDAQADISIHDFIDQLCNKYQNQPLACTPPDSLKNQPSRDNTIHFPYSRHSSYEELRHLVSQFRPKDICPCTVNPESWSEAVSMQTLFGDLCSDNLFFHDQETRAEVEARRAGQAPSQKRKRAESETDDDETQSQSQAECPISHAPVNVESTCGGSESSHEPESAFETQGADDELFTDKTKTSRYGWNSVRRDAYKAAVRALRDNDGSYWQDVVLRSVGRDGHTRGEDEL